MSPLTRREFMKTFGVGLASLIIASCRSSKEKGSPINEPTITPAPALTNTPSHEVYDVTTCYIIAGVEVKKLTPTASTLAPRDQLRACWLSFNELAGKSKTSIIQKGEVLEGDSFRSNLSAAHHNALLKLVSAGELEPAVADLVKEAYDAALYHVECSNGPFIFCYEQSIPDYAPTSAEQLIQQSAILAEMAEKSGLSPDTVELVKQTIRHDLAFEALTQEEVTALYKKLFEEYPQPSVIPSFDQVELEMTPDVEKASQFLIELLSEK